MDMKFADLFAGNLDAVRRSMLGRELLHIPGTVSRRFEDLFSWSDIEAVLSDCRYCPDDFSMYLGGKSLDLRLLGVFADEGSLRTAPFRSLAQQGVTLGGTHLERSFAEIAALAKEARSLFGGIVRCAFVASYGTVSGYPIHYDCDDLVICQVGGRKEWRFFGPPVSGSGYPFRDEGSPGAVTVTLELGPGDVLLVPSGLRHCCRPLEPSLHFGFAITWPTGVWIARRALENAVGRASLREPIRPFATAEDRLALEQSVRQELTALLSEIDLDEMSSEFLTRFAPR
jgi:ribosomal protein L16 Arg81 hydroxylase